MALLRIDHVPETVKVNLPLYIILPEPAKTGRCACCQVQSALPAAWTQRRWERLAALYIH